MTLFHICNFLILGLIIPLFIHLVCVCFNLLLVHERDKHSSRTVKYIFLRYSLSHKGHRCYDLVNRPLRISCHVIFFGNVPYYIASPNFDLLFLYPSSTPSAFAPQPTPTFTPTIPSITYPLPPQYIYLFHLCWNSLHWMSLPPPLMLLLLKSTLQLFHLLWVVLLILVAILREIVNHLFGIDIAWRPVILLSLYLFCCYTFFRGT